MVSLKYIHKIKISILILELCTSKSFFILPKLPIEYTIYRNIYSVQYFLSKIIIKYSADR